MRILAAVTSTLIVVLYAIGAGVWVSTGEAWYQGLKRPPWQPPDLVFGIIWPYNFGALIAAGIAVALVGSSSGVWIWFGALCTSVIAAPPR
ncbi:MAG: tryptophan-rich sensory protein [Actinomycetes bacterium]